MVLSQVTLVCLAALVLGGEIVFSYSSFTNCGDECPETCLCPCKQTTGECTEGCVAGYYGYNCNKTCDSRCKTKGCLQHSGQCGCVPGYLYTNSRCQKDTGTNCRTHLGCLNDKCSSKDEEEEKCIEGCKPGLFGTSCESPCGRNCFCDQESGKCTDCVPGWFGPECQSQCSSWCNEGCYKNGSCIDGCKPGSYGETCKSTCQEQCDGGLCDLNGKCTSCKTGFYGPRCSKICEECAEGDCDRDTGECNNEDRSNWMPYIIGGGVLLMVVVLAVCMVCCLKRMQGIVDNGMKSIGENSVVNFKPGPSASVCSWNTRVCGSDHASVDHTYNHLFAFKSFSVDSSFDDLETASGYCSVLLRDRVVINDGHDTQNATSLADMMSDDVGACGGVKAEDGKPRIIFLKSQEDEGGVLRENGNARNVRDMEVIHLSRLTNVDETHAGIGDWAGGKPSLKFKEDDEMEKKVVKIISLKPQVKDDDVCNHYHTQDSEDMDVILPMDNNRMSKLTDEEEACRTRCQEDQDEVKKVSMVCGDLHSSDAEDNNGKETLEDASDNSLAQGEAVFIEIEQTQTELGDHQGAGRNSYERSKFVSEVGAGGGVQREEARYEGNTTRLTWEGLQSNNKEAKEDGEMGGTTSGEGNDSSIIVDDEDNYKTEFSNGFPCHLSTNGVRLQSSGDDLPFDDSVQSPGNDNTDSSQRKTTKKESDRYSYVDIIVT